MKFSLAVLVAVLFAFNAQATTSDWATAPHIKARLVSEGEKFGVEMQMEEGWYTYYKISGEAGLPTTFDWAGSKDIVINKVTYPEYVIHDEAGLKTYGYDGEVFFPVDAKLGEKPEVNLVIEGAVCKDICIPYALKINKELPGKKI